MLIKAASIVGLVFLAFGTPLTLCLIAGFDVGVVGGVGVVLYFSGVALRFVALLLGPTTSNQDAGSPSATHC